jgi:hypothetical protein
MSMIRLSGFPTFLKIKRFLAGRVNLISLAWVLNGWMGLCELSSKRKMSFSLERSPRLTLEKAFKALKEF